MDSDWLYPIAAAALTLMLLVPLLVVQRLLLRRSRARERAANLLLEHIKVSKGVDKNIDFLLERLGTFVDAPVYAFYLYDQKNRQYLLKGVRHSETDFGKVRPSYSGLTAYTKESYIPPMLLSDSKLPSKTELIKEGEVPLLVVPIGDIGAVRIGPVRKASRRTKNRFDEFALQMKILLPELLLTESFKNQVDVVVASGKALQNISNAVVDTRLSLELILNASLYAVGAFAAVYGTMERDRMRIASFVGLNDSGWAGGEAFAALLRSKLDGKPSLILKQGDTDYYELPPEIAAEGAESVAIVRSGQSGVILFLFRKAEGAGKNANQFVTISSDLQGLLDAQTPIRHLSKVYINIMKKLARTMDNLNPYTVGYSEQMSKYAIVIGQELGLPDDEIRDIALAAYLSNIGVLGLSSELYQKEGKYTEAEYEMMKLHSEVGASIISVTTGNKRVASYIMHHHERIDGAGYPAGLRGPEIPVGSRIIAVVQTFLAKINGRPQRDPMPFDKALQTLMSASGTQLDKRMVDALVGWFQKKRTDSRRFDRSMGNCWEICCTPSSICEHCPVYAQISSGAQVNCWDVENNRCQAHGKSCSTCFVQTEFASRAAVKQRA